MPTLDILQLLFLLTSSQVLPELLQLPDKNAVLLSQPGVFIKTSLLPEPLLQHNAGAVLVHSSQVLVSRDGMHLKLARRVSRPSQLSHKLLVSLSRVKLNKSGQGCRFGRGCSVAGGLWRGLESTRVGAVAYS